MRYSHSVTVSASSPSTRRCPGRLLSSRVTTGRLTVHLGRRLVGPGVGELVRSGCCAGPVRARVDGPDPHSSGADTAPCHGLHCGAGPATLGEAVAARTDIPATAEVAARSVGYQPCGAIAVARRAMPSHRRPSAAGLRTLDAVPNSAFPTMTIVGSFLRPRPGPPTAVPIAALLRAYICRETLAKYFQNMRTKIEKHACPEAWR